MLDIESKKKNQSQHLSRGMLQKLALANALVTDPQILLLDEPTLGMDVASARKIKDVLIDLARNQKKTLLLTTHQMSLVEELADRVGILHNGMLVKEGCLTELKSIFQSNIFRLKVKGTFQFSAGFMKKYNIQYKVMQNEFTEMELDCINNAGVYNILEYLKKKKAEIISFYRVVEDLEELFLAVLDKHDPGYHHPTDN